ncbi:MAG: helix-turn-helix transcriptional regulator [Anaerolineales bacterium]|nr:helix-turn-helix transcriptional regulator [Anaerolineales bacterium]
MNTYSFGEWVKQRRKKLRLTQREVATAVYCSIAMIKKMEADERQPSVDLAQALATTLQIPPEQHEVFVEIARGERPLDHLANSRNWYKELIPQTAVATTRPLAPELVNAILCAGLLAAANQQPAQAATLLAATARFGASMNHIPPRLLAQTMSEAVTAVQSTLSSVEYETAVALGQQIPLTDLLTHALA